MSTVIGPIATSLRHGLWHHLLCDLRHLFHEVDIQSSTDVPCDMTVEGPHTRVISIVLDNHISGSWQHMHVTTLGVLDMRDRAIPSACSRG